MEQFPGSGNTPRVGAFESRILVDAGKRLADAIIRNDFAGMVKEAEALSNSGVDTATVIAAMFAAIPAEHMKKMKDRMRDDIAS